jgi:outer membrane lipoprotein SlyB
VDDDDEQKIGAYAFVGFAIGGITGMTVEAGNGNTFYGFWIGAFVGLVLGCFIFLAVSAVQNQNRKKEHK